MDLRKFDVCDNIDLETVLQEYESYYFVRFNKYPRITKKITNTSMQKTLNCHFIKALLDFMFYFLDISTKIAKTNK